MTGNDADQGGTGQTGAVPGRGAVSAAARASLGQMLSDHAGAPLLKAIALKLCEDIDTADRIPERISATRMVLKLLEVLDGAMFASTRLPTGTGDDEGPETDGEEADDPFQIGDLPPGVGDEAS